MVMKIAKEDNNNKTVGSLQSSEGQDTGSKVAIHTDLNRGGIADSLLLRTILAICQKSLDPSFWEVIDSLLYLHLQIWQLQEHFCKDYYPV